MFETAEREVKLSKAEYKEQAAAIRPQLLSAQRRLISSNTAVVILVNGVEGAGKGEVLNLLNEWFDARYTETHAFGEPTEEQAQRPAYWRYWMALPSRGQIGLILGNWYSAAILGHVCGPLSNAQFDMELSRIKVFEQALTDDDAVVIKLWLHVSKKRQRSNFKRLEQDPNTRARVTSRDWKLAKRYDDFIPVSEQAIRRTSTGNSPWFVVDAADPRHRNITIAQHVLTRLNRKLDDPKSLPSSEAPPPLDKTPDTILDDLDLTGELKRKTYDKRLEALQNRLLRLAMTAERKGQSAIVVFEGWDAAGKGGAIRRLIHNLDARQYRVIPTAAPTEEERAHHYLWRFWRHIPRRGKLTLYDRSWYGRVLVERVEGFARDLEWRRAYAEINDFEAQLDRHGIILVKFWLHISQQEQWRRFEERRSTPWKAHKITDEDYRNREKAPAYAQAVSEMISRTSTQYAPWTLVAAENKQLGRLNVLETVCERLARALDNG